MTSWRTTGCTSKLPAHFPQSRAELWKNRAIICPIKSRGGPGVPPLRIPSASLHSAPSPKREGCGRVRTPAPTRIQERSRSPRRGRSQTGQPSMGKFPGYGGRGTPQGGFSCPCGAIHLQPLPYGFQESLSVLGRGAPWGSRQNAHRYRWLGKVRRRSGTSLTAIFADPGPSGPGGTADRHSNFARRKFSACPKG